MRTDDSRRECLQKLVSFDRIDPIVSILIK